MCFSRFVLVLLFRVSLAGFVLAKNNSGKRKACDVPERSSDNWEMKAKSDKLTYWNCDSPHSKDDPVLRSFYWFAVAEAVSFSIICCLMVQKYASILINLVLILDDTFIGLWS